MIGRSIPALIASALRVPLERRLAGPPRDQDRQLGLAWRQAGVVAQELAQRLPAVRQLGAVQRGAQRADDSAAAAGHHLVVDAALLGVHGFGRGKTQTWHRGDSGNWTASLRAASATRQAWRRISAMQQDGRQDGLARHGALRRRPGHRQLRHAAAVRRLGREGCRAGRFLGPRHQSRLLQRGSPDAAALPLPEAGALPGCRQH